MSCEHCPMAGAGCCVCETVEAPMTLPEKIADAVREWPQWSPAERRRMNDVIEDVLHHCRTGQGNRFVREWCDRNLAHLFTR